MTKIVEIRETTADSRLYMDLYDINKLSRSITFKTEFVCDLPQVDYNYLSILANKSKLMLSKIHQIMELNEGSETKSWI